MREPLYRPCTSLEVSYISISKSSITLRFFKPCSKERYKITLFSLNSMALTAKLTFLGNLLGYT